MLQMIHLLPPSTLDLKLAGSCSSQTVDVPQGPCLGDGHGLLVGAIGGTVDLVKVGQVGVVIVRGLESPEDLQQKAWLDLA